MPTQLTDLEVDRVDAVDRPATRRKFLIVKAEDNGKPAEGKPEDPPASDQVDVAKAAAEGAALLTKAAAAMTALAKSEGLNLGADAIAPLNELIDAIGDQAITKFEAPKPPEADVAKSEAITKSDLAALPASIAAAVVEGIRKAAEADDNEPESIERSAPASAQPAVTPVAKSATRKMGDGLFSNIVYGR